MFEPETLGYPHNQKKSLTGTIVNQACHLQIEGFLKLRLQTFNIQQLDRKTKM